MWGSYAPSETGMFEYDFHRLRDMLRDRIRDLGHFLFESRHDAIRITTAMNRDWDRNASDLRYRTARSRCRLIRAFDDSAIREHLDAHSRPCSLPKRDALAPTFFAQGNDRFRAILADERVFRAIGDAAARLRNFVHTWPASTSRWELEVRELLREYIDIRRCIACIRAERAGRCNSTCRLCREIRSC